MSLITTPSRRSFLRSATACLALPCLDTFAAAASDLPGPKKRMIFLGQGYGFLPDFYPTKAAGFRRLA